MAFQRSYSSATYMNFFVIWCFALRTARCSLNTVIGLAGEDFVLLGGDTKFFRGVTTMSEDYKKVIKLDNSIAAAVCGEQGDVDMFIEWIQRRIYLKRICGQPFSVKTVANIIRNEISTSLRSRPQDINVLLGGWCKGKVSLYWIDSMGAMQKIPYGVHGIASSFILSVLDSEYSRTHSFEECLNVFQKCFKQLTTRYAVDSSDYQCMIIDCNGCRELCSAGGNNEYLSNTGDAKN